MRKGEKLNAITHMVGASLAVVGLAVLVVLASLAHDPWRIVSFSVYGTTLVLLYLFSTLYHGLSGRAKRVFQVFDHLSIYLLIAGTYTPFTLVTLPRRWGWSLFGAVWGMAIAGVLLEVLTRRWRALSYVLYVLMGWLVLVALRPLAGALSTGGLAWLLGGGILYTGGLVAYGWRSLPRHHELWHFFVLGGSVCHFVAMLLYVA